MSEGEAPKSIKEVNVVLDEIKGALNALSLQIANVSTRVGEIESVQPQSAVVVKKPKPKRKWDTPEYRNSPEYR